MRDAPFRPPDAHVFVCTNRRAPGDPLGPGCGGAGDALHAALAAELDRRGLRAKVWLARAHCLGVCPKQGACVAVTPGESGGRSHLLTEADAADATSILALATSG